MSKSLNQITFEFSGEEQKEFLSGNPVPPKEVLKPKSPRGRKSLKEAESSLENVVVPDDEILFQKQYYSIGEVATMFAVNTSLIRFWENEFDILEPKKNKKGDRYFRPVDVKNLVMIYHLLRVRKFTLGGAKEYLQSHKKAGDSFELITKLEKLKSFLLELKANL